MYIIIGQGAAGAAAAFLLRRIDPQAEITVVTEEKDWYYSRILLTDALAAHISRDALTLRDAQSFQSAGICCRMGVRVTAIDRTRRCVALEDGTELFYDKLLLATGSSPVKLPVHGADAEGIECLWNTAQLDRLNENAKSASCAVVMGAGLIGVKSAIALSQRGIQTILTARRRIMTDRLDETASELVREELEANGIRVMTEATVSEWRKDAAGHICAAIIDGREYPCQLAVLAAGTRANTQLAEQAGLEVERGILVDRHMQTSDPDIFAAGDAAQVCDCLTGQSVKSATWPGAVEQGETAVRNMAGSTCVYDSYLAVNSTHFLTLPIVSAGRIQPEEGDKTMVYRKGRVYRKLVLRGGRLAGMLLVGEISGAGILADWMRRQLPADKLSPEPGAVCFADAFS